MQVKMVFLVFVLVEWVPSSSLKISPESPRRSGEKYCGEIVFLTPYLKGDRASDGKLASRVPPMLPGIESYAGFFTVNETYGSNLFFWFFPAETNDSSSSIVLVLGGWPGLSFVYDIFTGKGPFLMDGESNLRPNNVYWSQAVNVIFIDPVDVGFSFTNNISNNQTSEEEIVSDIYAAVIQFLQLFPEYRANDFFIAGESYGGKYATRLGYTIHQKNPTAHSKVNLKGLLIGSGWLDPLSQLNYSQWLYYLGLIDFKTRQEFAQIENEIKTSIKNNEYLNAFSRWDDYFGGFLQPSRAMNVTGFAQWNNFLQNIDPLLTTLENVEKFFYTAHARDYIHVGDTNFIGMNLEVYQRYGYDFFLSVVSPLETLIKNYRVLLYYGQLDIMCAYTSSRGFVGNLKWDKAIEYKNATRKQWHALGDLGGYVKTTGNFTELLVRDVGHKIALDNPVLALELIVRFTQNIPFDEIMD